jgi:predicted KAP-like P-loop ATPase
MSFNPWFFSNEDQLISQFFTQLSTKLGKDLTGKRKRKLYSNISKYTELLILGSDIPIVGSIFRAIQNFFKNSPEENSIEVIKEKIIQTITKYEKRLVITIDDIDRLNNSEICLIFKLTKAIADFPKTTYILAYDKDIVVNALKDEQMKDGNAYLEKIIQVSLDVPSVTGEKFSLAFTNKLNEIITESNEDEYDKSRWYYIYFNGVNQYLNSFRDVNRLLNAYKFYYSISKEFTNFVDLLAIIAIYVFENPVINMLAGRKDDLTATFANGMRDNKQEKDKLKQLYKSILEASNNRTAISSIFEELFPKLSQVSSSFTCRHYDRIKARKLSQICSPDCFDSYFSFILNENAVSPRKVRDIMNLEDKTTITEQLTVLRNENRLGDFFLIARGIIQEGEIKEASYYALLDVLFAADNDFYYSRPNMFELDYNSKLFFFVTYILEAMDNDNMRFDLLQHLFSNEKNDLYLLGRFLNFFERRFGRWTNEKKEPQHNNLISIYRLKKLEKIMLNRFIQVKDDRGHFSKILLSWYTWLNLDKELLDKFVNENINDDYFLAILITKNIGEGENLTLPGGMFYTYSHKNSEPYIKESEAYKRLKKYIDKETIKQFPMDIKPKIIAFIIRNEKKLFSNDDCVPKEDADKWLNNLTK